MSLNQTLWSVITSAKVTSHMTSIAAVNQSVLFVVAMMCYSEIC